MVVVVLVVLEGVVAGVAGVGAGVDDGVMVAVGRDGAGGVHGGGAGGVALAVQGVPAGERSR